MRIGISFQKFEQGLPSTKALFVLNAKTKQPRKAGSKMRIGIAIQKFGQGLPSVKALFVQKAKTKQKFCPHVVRGMMYCFVGSVAQRLRRLAFCLGSVVRWFEPRCATLFTNTNELIKCEVN